MSTYREQCEYNWRGCSKSHEHGVFCTFCIRHKVQTNSWWNSKRHRAAMCYWEHKKWMACRFLSTVLPHQRWTECRWWTVAEAKQNRHSTKIETGHTTKGPWRSSRCREMQKKGKRHSLLAWNQDIERVISRCETCQKHRNKQTKEPTVVAEVPTAPWHKVGMDLFHLKGKKTTWWSLTITQTSLKWHCYQTHRQPVS